MKICVFCASSENVPEKYKEPVRALGLEMGRRGHSLVFGGYETGLMGVISNGVHDAEGKVYGVVPDDVNKFKARRVFKANELVEVDNIGARKSLMKNLADAFIAAPGSYGTFDEIFEVLVEQKLGADHRKPIAFYNIEGYYDSLLQKLSSMVEEGFMPPSDLDLFIVGENPEELLDELEAWRERLDKEA